MHPSPAGERLDRDLAERDAIADLAEDLPRAALIVRDRAIEEAREDNRAVGVDRVPCERAGCAQIEPTKAPSAIGRHMAGVGVGAAVALCLVAGASIARRDADAPVAADARVNA